MKYAIIDVGSNTIRLTVNVLDGSTIQNLFHKKIVAGLASYVEQGQLNPAGITRVCDALAELQILLSHFEIDQTAVFATASLRNISNTDEALDAIAERTGFHVDLLSGEQEAILGYYGICQEIPARQGILLDIGGGSTEITSFHAEGPEKARSFPLGSLNLYAACVKKGILPDKKERDHMKQALSQLFSEEALAPFRQTSQLYAVGGSARAALKLTNYVLELPPDNRTLTSCQLKELKKLLQKNDQSTARLLLQHCPDRIHTLIPGFLILYTLFKKLDGETITVCRYGVREGYLWDRYLREASGCSPDSLLFDPVI